MTIKAKRGRGPFAVTFLHRDTGTRFIFMVNHLYRGNSWDNRFKRLNQSESLTQWARFATLPVIAAGDYNYDWKISDGNHDSGFDALTSDDVFTWVRPGQLIGTQYSVEVSNPTSVPDFVFVSGVAKTWNGSSEILETPPSFCPDSAQCSDHRPVKAEFTIQWERS